uniref:Glycosyl transferase 48 domain-containing protein n=1 Tax=Tanacetum cinerariifolium TaxID=118510 RepID=A0A699KRA6_TANCI|nr:hypothetical protein [Tanacetum cinerariifolium]
MLSFYYTSVGYYFFNWLMVITLYILLYGQLIIALSGIRVAHMFIHQDLLALLLIIYPAIYMILGSLLEQNFEKARISYFTMQKSGSSTFFTFSLGTRMHWFGRTILHGGSGVCSLLFLSCSFIEVAKGRLSLPLPLALSAVINAHIMELLLLVYCGLFGLKEAPELKNNIVRTSGTILALALILAPFLFDPSDYTDHDHKEDYEEWKHWLYSSGDESWVCINCVLIVY